MATHVSHHAGGHVWTITAHHVVGLDLKPYVEYRLEERDASGLFVGYSAMGSRPFVEQAFQAVLDRNVRELDVALTVLEGGDTDADPGADGGT